MKREKSTFQAIVYSKLIFILILAVISGVVAIASLRNNYSTMVELREAVIAADEKDGDIEGALQSLREHVHRHMNTDLSSGPNAISPPIQLKYRYDRLMAAESERIKALNAQVEARGGAICAQRFPAGGLNPPRVACIQDYVSENAVTEASVAEDLYKFDFVSPKWSPDLAGFSLIISVLAAAVFAILAALKILKQRL